MIEQIVNFDISVTEFFANGALPAFLDKIMVFITTLGEAGALWIISGIILLFFKKTRTAGVAMLLSLSIVFLLNQLVLKELVDRPRPFQILKDIELLIGTPRGSSFPSSHAATSFAAATSLFCFNKIYGGAALFTALLIAFSRIYLCVHFLSDVVFGTVLGLALGLILTHILFFKKESEVSAE